MVLHSGGVPAGILALSNGLQRLQTYYDQRRDQQRPFPHTQTQNHPSPPNGTDALPAARINVMCFTRKQNSQNICNGSQFNANASDGVESSDSRRRIVHYWITLPRINLSRLPPWLLSLAEVASGGMAEAPLATPWRRRRKSANNLVNILTHRRIRIRLQ